MDPKILEGMLAMKVGVPNDPSMLAESTKKSHLFAEHEFCINEVKKLSADKRLTSNFVQTTSPGFRPSVPVQLIPANRVDIATLAKNTDKVLEGKYFLCRILAPPIKMASIITVVEDPRGQQGIRLTLYNYFSLDIQDLHVAQILAIKNPVFKSTRGIGFLLQCNNPADVLVVSESLSEELFPGVKWEGEIPIKWQKFIKSPPRSAIEWKNEGNKLFVDRKYQKAIQCYTDGLNIKDSGNGHVSVTCDMLSNRSAAYLKLDCFQNALEDVNKLLEIDQKHIKGLYRKGKSLLGLQRFEEVIKYLNKVGNLKILDSENQKLFTELLKLAEILLKQQRTGEYDIVKLYKQGAVRHDDCADYVGPVKVQEIDGRGRGLVATQDIEPGQLISATKAFVIVFPEPLGLGRHLEAELNPNFETNLLNESSQRKLVEEIAQKLTLEPSLCREVYQLYGGADFPIYGDGTETENGIQVVDMKRIDAICTFNAFGGIVSSENVISEHKFLNEFGMPIHSRGLWVLPSFANHSCSDCNAIWRDYGDMLFVRAFKKISQGEEILISYLDPMQLYENREKIMKRHGFVCECRLCQIDRDDSVEGRKRAELLEKIHKYWKNEDERNEDGELKNIDFMMTFFKNIWDLDKKGQNPNLKINPSLAYPQIELAQYYFNPKRPQFKKSINLLTKCYDLTINSPLKDFALECCVNLVAAHLMIRNAKEAKNWTETLKKELLIFYGTLDMAKVVVRREIIFLMKKYKIPVSCFYFLSNELGFCDGEQ